VAEFHRLPEHPGDCCGELRSGVERLQRCHGSDFHDINIYNALGGWSQNALALTAAPSNTNPAAGSARRQQRMIWIIRRFTSEIRNGRRW
jgi:hypothetical protein